MDPFTYKNNQQAEKSLTDGLHYVSPHVMPDDHVLTRLYANQQSVRVRLVSRTKRPRIPTVRELIDQLSKKHERLLREELEQEKRVASSDSSTNTSSGPYSSDILYGSDVDKGGTEFRLAHSSAVDLDRVKESKREKAEFKDQRKGLYSRDSLSSSLERVSLDKDDRPNPSISSLAKINQFKPNGLRSSLLPKGRNGQDELVAMGTLWSPNLHPKPLRTLSVCTNNNTSTTGSTPRRVSSVTAPSSGYRQALNAPNTQLTGKLLANDHKYGDPLVGAPPQYQQRLAELSTLEADTVRYERTRKLKKKQPKQDRDS